MFRSFKSDKRIVQTLPLPVGLRGTPVEAVPGNTVDKLVVSKILRALVEITSACAGCSDQSQPERVVVGFVRSILAIGKDGRAKLAAHISEVDPLMRWHLELLWLRSGSFDRTDVPAVRCHAIRGCHRERRFEVRLFCIPVDHIRELHTFTRIARRKPYRLAKARPSTLTRYFQGHTRGAAFHNTNLRRTADVCLWCGLLLVPIHIPRRPLPRIIVRDRKAGRRGEQLPANRFIENARDVTARIQLYAVVLVFKR